MTIAQAFILSVIEGITEFLPISSTGHMILASNLLAIPQTEFLKTFEIVIQLGAILAVFPLFVSQVKKTPSLLLLSFLGFLPTAIIALASYKSIKTIFLVYPLITVISLILGGILFILVEKLTKHQERKKTIASLRVRDVIIIGLFQSVSIIPGVSRAGATIMGSMMLGLTRQEAVSFSFFLAIPTIIIATLYEFIASPIEITTNNMFILVLGGMGAYISARLTIQRFLIYVKTSTFIPFGVYRILVGILFFFFILL